MNLHKGAAVRFKGCTKDQRNWGGHADDSILEVGEHYAVERVEVHKWYTNVWLVGHGGHYNSVCFEKVEDEQVSNAEMDETPP